MRTESFINEYVYLLLSYKNGYVEITMEKYNAKRDPKVYAALSLLGASGCRPIQIVLQVDPKELAQISYALTGKTPKEVEGAITLIRKIYHIQNGQFTVKKVEQNGETIYKVGQTGDSLANEELPPLNELIDIIREAAGEDGIATPQEVGAYFRKVVKGKGDNPEYDIYQKPEPVEETANKNLEKKIEPEEKDTEGSATKINIEDQTTTLDQKIKTPDQKIEAITEVPSNPEPQTSAGYIKKGGVALTGALVMTAALYGAYKLTRVVKRMWNESRGMKKKSVRRP